MILLNKDAIKEVITKVVKTEKYWSLGEFGREKLIQDAIAHAQAMAIYLNLLKMWGSQNLIEEFKQYITQLEAELKKED
jgi:hypothetical protein